MRLNLNQLIIAFSLVVAVCFAGCEEKDFKSSREDDELEMSNLRKEIDKMSEQVNCDNAVEWKFTAIGSKSCGGPTAYVAYSTKIDEALFLKKVAIYNQKQKAFIVKWSLISDCMILTPPKSIECVNDKPKLVY